MILPFKKFLKQNYFIRLDGAFGTNVLKKYPNNYDAIELFNFTDAELVYGIHRAYVAAGADIINTNTFSANSYKLKAGGYSVEETVKRAVAIARSAGAPYVALDIGPLGKLLKPLGDMTLEEAYAAFKEIIVAGANAGADLVYFETFSDLLELKTGILAAKENSKLPVFATMTFEPNGKTFVGVSPAAAAVTLEALGVDAFGLNCSSGPDKMLPIVREIAEVSNIPVIVKPNAGIPEMADGKSVYKMTVSEYIEDLEKLIDAGACCVGGCCGTEAAHIEAIGELLRTKNARKKPPVKKTLLASQSTVKVIDDNFTVIGERLNPTGKPALKKALTERNSDYLISEARAQIQAFADVLDINAGIFEIDEAETLGWIVECFNGIIDVPFCLDSSDKKALELAVRRVAGLPILNSVNGKVQSLDSVMPIAKKYGTPVVCLLLDESGIPKTLEDRIRIAKRIFAYAKKYGVGKEKLIFDCLTLTASAEQANVLNTLKAVEIIYKKYGCNTVLGLSNVSFGLPAREFLNSAFLSHALSHGLTSAILNPLNAEVMASVDAYRVLYNKDPNASAYIEKYKNLSPRAAVQGGVPALSLELEGNKLRSGGAGESLGSKLKDAIIKGGSLEAKRLSYEALDKEDGLTLINSYLIPALDEVGALYEKGKIFLPELLLSANAAKASFDTVKEKSAKSLENRGAVLLATVFGDVHDIGKNIAKMLLENYGYSVIDLGKDVPIDTIIKAVRDNDIKLVGLSALMTTTLGNMRDTIAAVRAVSDAKIMVGGAVVTKENSRLIGADYYCKDAIDGVGVARGLLDLP